MWGSADVSCGIPFDSQVGNTFLLTETSVSSARKTIDYFVLVKTIGEVIKIKIDEDVKIKINKINYAFHKYEKLVTLHHVK